MSNDEQSCSYPIRCIDCGKKEVLPATLDHYHVQKTHNGRLYDLVVDDLPVTKCNACGNFYFTTTSMAAAEIAFERALGIYRSHQAEHQLTNLSS